MDNERSFGSWLRRRRRALDITQAELARQVGCAEGTVRNLEADTLRPSKRLAERLARTLGVPATDVAAVVSAARGGAGALPDEPPPPISLSTVTHEPVDVAAPVLPSGTVTFLFTNIEGSTRLWEQYPQAMPAALARHTAIVGQAITTHGGRVFKTVGDALCAVFVWAPDALVAARTAQQMLLAEPWGDIGALRVRMAIHTGTVTVHEGDYLGLPLSRAARLLAAAHGGQILLSRATWELVHEHLPPAAELHDLGTHRLKDLTHPEQIFQLVAPEVPAQFPPLQALRPQRTNLPAQSTALIGRQPEVAAVLALLRQPDIRLVTLTGPGGTGKTRLALQVAAELLDTFPDGVYFVDLTRVSNPAMVVATIAQTLGVFDSAGRPVSASLHAALRDQQILLLLDNFEHLVEAASEVAEFLAACPALKVLVTSRIVLQLAGEHEWVVPPLSVPDGAQVPNLNQLTQYEAVRLFIERAQAVKADFALSSANARSVADICVRLEGLPLAIELAAARIKLFSPAALLVRLDHRLTFLTSGARDRPARQQTLRSAIDWSYQLLAPDEQILFRRLAVFVGGCALEAAEKVCTAHSAQPLIALDGLEALVSHSLLRVLPTSHTIAAEADTEPRFDMLETIREYALEQLAGSGEEALIRQAHLNFFAALAEAAAPALSGPAQAAWLARLEAEHDNLRMALHWAQATGQIECLLQLAVQLGEFWQIRGHQREGRQWLETGLAAVQGERPVPLQVQAQALLMAGRLANAQADYAGAIAPLEASLTHFRALDDRSGVARALYGLGTNAWVQAEYARARALITESLTLARALGDDVLVMSALVSLGSSAALAGDVKLALPLLSESLVLARLLGDTQQAAIALTNLGYCHWQQGDLVGAEAHYGEALIQLQAISSRWFPIYPLIGLAGVAVARGQLERAARLLGMVEVLQEDLGTRLVPAIEAWYDRLVGTSRANLDATTFQRSWAEGRALPLERIIAEAQEAHPPLGQPDPRAAIAAPPAPAYPAGLTEREVEVLRLVAKGLTNAQIATRLIVAPTTINAHLRSIFSKLGVSSRAAATRFALEQHLV